MKIKNEELSYWAALAHSSIATKRINEILTICHQRGESLSALFQNERTQWATLYQCSEAEIQLLQEAKSLLANYAFMVENLLSQGYNLIPILDEQFPQTLKDNLKYATPPLLYTKGNTELLHKLSVAIVGSRKAQPISLAFADKVAQKVATEGCVVVSGDAKGIDQQGEISALEAGGEVIIVLPQGITTYTGYKRLYQYMVAGKVLVVSQFQSTAPWNAGLAMARNTTIYGMAKQIYVAESGTDGGTYSGVIDGLRKGREIFVRMADEKENNANNSLLQHGAIAVDMDGNRVDNSLIPDYKQLLIDYLTTASHTEKECAIHLYGDTEKESVQKVKHLLKQIDGIIVDTTSKSPKKYTLQPPAPTLF